jgi:hypothetical protein
MERGKRDGRVRVTGKEFEGLGLDRDQVISHIRQLRGLIYQILNVLVLGNAKTSMLLLQKLTPRLSQILLIESLKEGLFSSEASFQPNETTFESLDLLLNLCSSKDLFQSVFKQHLS